MMEGKELFGYFQRQILGSEYDIDYYEPARQIISDMRYFYEHIKRTKINTKFDFRIYPDLDCRISGHFVRAIFDNDYFAWRDEEKVIKLLKIYDITYELFNRDTDSEEIVKMIIEWAKVVDWYAGVNLKDHVPSFIGCSGVINGVLSLWDKIEKEMNELREFDEIDDMDYNLDMED